VNNGLFEGKPLAHMDYRPGPRTIEHMLRINQCRRLVVANFTGARQRVHPATPSSWDIFDEHVPGRPSSPALPTNPRTHSVVAASVRRNAHVENIRSRLA